MTKPICKTCGCTMEEDKEVKGYKTWECSTCGNKKSIDKTRKKIGKASLLAIVFLTILLLPVICSATQTFKQNDNVNLKLQCIINGTYCSASAYCNISISYPNASLLVNNQRMTNQISFHNYTLPNTATLGDYLCSATCCDGGNCGTGTDCDYIITTTGNKNNIQTAIFYIVGLLVILFFLGLCLMSFYKFDNLLNKVGMIGLGYLLIVAISFIAWQMSNDFLSNISFITSMFWIIFLVLIIGILPMVIGGFAYYLIMLFKVKEIQRLMDKGLDYNEANRRGGSKYT